MTSVAPSSPAALRSPPRASPTSSPRRVKAPKLEDAASAGAIAPRWERPPPTVGGRGGGGRMDALNGRRFGGECLVGFEVEAGWMLPNWSTTRVGSGEVWGWGWEGGSRVDNTSHTLSFGRSVSDCVVSPSGSLRTLDYLDFLATESNLFPSYLELNNVPPKCPSVSIVCCDSWSDT